MSLPPEFDLIARHFSPLAGEGALGLTDDAALLALPMGRELVICADAMVQGVHYLPDDPPDTIGRKLLRVNLSDLAAMGAVPLAYLMTLSLPARDDDWLAAFARGLAVDQAEYGIRLLGGDTTGTSGPAVLSLTAIGHVAPGMAVRRSGARPGDDLFVTGTIGDGALGLAVLQGRLSVPGGEELADRYRLPRPRLLPIAGIASAAMDVSDGLVQDLGHICRASGCGAEIDAALVPLSAPARAAGPDWLTTCLTGGDDYELLLACPPQLAGELHAACAPVPLTQIGVLAAGTTGVRVRGVALPPAQGWSHFRR